MRALNLKFQRFPTHNSCHMNLDIHCRRLPTYGAEFGAGSFQASSRPYESAPSPGGPQAMHLGPQRGFGGEYDGKKDAQGFGCVS
jgi:hypothetical protein